MMKYLLKPIEKIVNYIINNSKNRNTDIKELKIILRSEIDRIEVLMLEELLSEYSEPIKVDYFNINMQKLSVMCDRLYAYEWKELNSSETAELILNLIVIMKDALPRLIGRESSVPRLFRIKECPSLQKEWEIVREEWDHFSLDPALLEIAHLPIDEFYTNDRKMSWFHFMWLKKYLKGLAHIDFTTLRPYPKIEYFVYEHLIKMNFNHFRFAAYCEETIEHDLDTFTEKIEQIYFLNMAKKIIGQIPVLSAEPFYSGIKTVKEELFQWIDLESEFRQHTDDQLITVKYNKKHVNTHKFKFNLTVEQLAFWQKLQFDNKIYEKENLDLFCEKVAYNSSTSNQEELSPGSIKSKLYSKNISLIRPIYGILEKMMAELKLFLNEQ